jgi:hypothetical protein
MSVATSGVAPQVAGRVPAGSDPQEGRRQLCQTNGALSAAGSRPSAVVSLAADLEGVLAPAVVAGRVFVMASAEALQMVEMANRARVLDPDGLVAKANILVVPGLVVLK